MLMCSETGLLNPDFFHLCCMKELIPILELPVCIAMKMNSAIIQDGNI